MSAPWLRPLHRGRGDARPTAPVTVVLASTGSPISEAAVDRAASLADGNLTAVVSIARVHGSAFGLPNPGLLPTRRERAEQRAIVSAAIDALARRNVEADGQVITTRNPGRSITRTARNRAASYVVLDAPQQGRLRRLVEGDPIRALRRGLANRATLIVISAQADHG
jgi:universal stress protein family protein